MSCSNFGWILHLWGWTLLWYFEHRPSEEKSLEVALAFSDGLMRSFLTMWTIRSATTGFSESWSRRSTLHRPPSFTARWIAILVVLLCFLGWLKLLLPVQKSLKLLLVLHILERLKNLVAHPDILSYLKPLFLLLTLKHSWRFFWIFLHLGRTSSFFLLCLHFRKVESFSCFCLFRLWGFLWLLLMDSSENSVRGSDHHEGSSSSSSFVFSQISDRLKILELKEPLFQPASSPAF